MWKNILRPKPNLSPWPYVSYSMRKYPRLKYSKIIILNHNFWRKTVFLEIFIYHFLHFYKIPSFYIINLHLKRQYTISAFEFAMIYSGCTDKIYRLHQHSQYKTVHSSLQQQTKSLQILQKQLIISTAFKKE